MRKDRFRITLWLGATPFSKACRTIGEVVGALENALGRPMDQRQYKAIISMAVALVMDNRSAECDLTSPKAPMRVTLAYNAG